MIEIDIVYEVCVSVIVYSSHYIFVDVHCSLLYSFANYTSKYVCIIIYGEQNQ